MNQAEVQTSKPRVAPQRPARLHPQFSDFDLQSLVTGALPLAFAAAEQTAVVISGGIDLSIGYANVLAASTNGESELQQGITARGVAVWF
jgi:ribose/xylose/arabinose/galactoside ABC-type transport system permease subunit